jgi:hypothetical protein
MKHDVGNLRAFVQAAGNGGIGTPVQRLGIGTPAQRLGVAKTALGECLTELAEALESEQAAVRENAGRCTRIDRRALGMGFHFGDPDNGSPSRRP